MNRDSGFGIRYSVHLPDAEDLSQQQQQPTPNANKMKPGFLIQSKKGESKKDSSGFGPLHDERSTRIRSGWGASSFTEDDDPWVQRFEEVALAHQQFGADDESPARNVDENPYRNMPNLPYKTYGEPMNALGAYYSQYYHTSHMKMSDYYYTWNDENPKSHLLLWTSIFICPLSGELFMSGKWPGNDVVLKEEATPTVTTDLTEQNDGAKEETDAPFDESTTTPLTSTTAPNSDRQARWLKKKKAAEHGAAAWAYDCFQYRHQQSAVAHRELDSPSTAPPPPPLLVTKREVNATSAIGCELPYMEDMAIRVIPDHVPDTIRKQIMERLMEIGNDRIKYGESGMNAEKELAWCSPADVPQVLLSETIVEK